MPIPDDPHLLGTCCDMVIRCKGHGSYKGDQGAIKALARRAPGFESEEYRALFELLCRVYDRAVEAIRRHPAERTGKRSRYAEYEDIDHEACMAELERIEPGVAVSEKRAILSWVIYWHYQK